MNNNTKRAVLRNTSLLGLAGFSESRGLRVLLIPLPGKVEVVIEKLVFGNVVRSEDVPNVESELHDGVTQPVLHLMFSDELEDKSCNVIPL